MQVCHHLRKFSTVTAKTLSESSGTSIIAIKRNLAAMQSVLVIKPAGSAKTGASGDSTKKFIVNAITQTWTKHNRY